jgi:hypothetical protein
MTNDERKKIYTALAAAFTEDAIERTNGKLTGRGYDTTGIKYQYIVNRLNEVLGVGGWRAHRQVTVKETATSTGRKAYEAVCELVLQLGAWVDGEFQVFGEAVGDGGHTSMSEADARKGSYTNALKKTAAMFGCGRQAYEGTLDDDNVPQEVVHHQEPTPPPPPKVTHPTPHRPPPPAITLDEKPVETVSNTRARLTAKQLACIWGVGRRAGMEQAGLRTTVKSKFGVQPEFLTRSQASEFIGWLTNSNGSNGETEHREPGQEG